MCWAVLSLSVLIAALAVALAADTIASIPVKLNDSYRIFIPVRINGSGPLWCGLDSGGGALLYLDQGKASAMGIQPTEEGRSAGPQDQKLKRDARARVTLEVPGVKLVNQTLVIESRPFAEFSCVIGLMTFRQYVVEVDYETPAVRLFDPERYQYPGSGHALPFLADQDNPFVTVTLTLPKGDDLQARLAVDTGGGAFFALLSKSFVDKNQLMSRVLKTIPDPSFGYADKQARVLVTRMKKFALGPFEVPRPVVHLWQVRGFGGAVEPDGLLCGDFLRRFKLIFDCPRHRLILQPNAHYRDDPPFDASSLRVYREGQNP